MNRTQLKEHYKRDIEFHLRCARESVHKLEGELDIENVEEHEYLTYLDEVKSILFPNKD
jgi:hypothetical protein